MHAGGGQRMPLVRSFVRVRSAGSLTERPAMHVEYVDGSWIDRCSTAPCGNESLRRRGGPETPRGCRAGWRRLPACRARPQVVQPSTGHRARREGERETGGGQSIEAVGRGRPRVYISKTSSATSLAPATGSARTDSPVVEGSYLPSHTCTEDLAMRLSALLGAFERSPLPVET